MLYFLIAICVQFFTTVKGTCCSFSQFQKAVSPPEMPGLKSDRQQSEQIRDPSRQFTSVVVLLRQDTHIYTSTDIRTKCLK